jgi:hypothetical protein
MLSAKQKGDFTKAYQDTFLIENEIEAERTRI